MVSQLQHAPSELRKDKHLGRMQSHCPLSIRAAASNNELLLVRQYMLAGDRDASA